VHVVQGLLDEWARRIGPGGTVLHRFPFRDWFFSQTRSFLSIADALSGMLLRIFPS